MQELREQQTHLAWERFLDSYADVIFRVVRLFADTYDDRMDLFLFVCDRLRADDMRRVRSFRYRPEAPCRFSTFLAVVTRNLSMDFRRAREGRFRHFRSMRGRDATDRLLFEYHLRDGRPIEEARSLLLARHGLRLSAGEACERAERLQTSLTPNQRWRLLSRFLARRPAMTIDPVDDVALGGPGLPDTIPLAGGRGDPEGALHSSDAERVLADALEALVPRQRLAMVLRYRDGLPARDVGKVIDASAAEAERLARDGLDIVREKLRRSCVARPDLDAAGLSSISARHGGARP